MTTGPTERVSVLVVDDEENVRECVRRFLEIAGYEALIANDGLEALEVLRTRHVDLILTDIAMPRMNGYQLHEQVIANPEWVTIPIIFVTARALDSDIRYGKELGVDDYITKPFRFEDLVAAVRGRLRRAQQLATSLATSGPEPEALLSGGLQIDSNRHRVWVDREAVQLSAREFRLLEYLARNRDRVVSLEELIHITHSLTLDAVEAGSLLRPLVRSLRRKLGYDVGEMGCIESVRGVGYQLVLSSNG